MSFRIKKYTVQNLRELLDSNIWNEYTTYPITKHKAISSINNPNAELDDPALFVGVDKNGIVGIVCTTPDFLFVDDKPVKMAWLSAWWVHEDYRNGMLGGMLFMKAMTGYQNRVCTSGVTTYAPGATPGWVFQETGKFEELFTREGKFFQIKNPRVVLTKPTRAVSRYKKNLYNISIDVQNFLLEKQMKKWSTKRLKYLAQIEVEMVHHVDKEANDFINQHGSKDLFRRRANEFNWIKKFPWVITAPIKDRLAEKYTFPGNTNFFELYYCKIYKESELIGFVILQQRNNHLSVEYAFFDENHLNDICLFILHFAVEAGISSLTILYEKLAQRVKEFNFPLATDLTKKIKFVISEKFLNNNQSGFNVHPGDGHNIFT